jgi:hypothetical protein
VRVPKSYVANTITDAPTLRVLGYKMEKTDKLLNMAVVPDNSRARFHWNGGNSELQRAWYHNQVAKFFLFNEAPLSVSGDSVPVSPIYDGFTVNPEEPNGGMEFCTDHGSKQTHNIVGTVPGRGAFTQTLWNDFEIVSRTRRPNHECSQPWRCGTSCARMREARQVVS